VDVGKGVECAEARRVEVVDVGGALFLDEAAVRVEGGVEVLLEDTGADGLFVKDGWLEDGARGEGDRGDERGVHGGDTHATEAAPKGTVAEPGRGGEVLLRVWRDDGGCCGDGGEGRRGGDGGQLGRGREVGEGTPVEETLFEGRDLLAEGGVLRLGGAEFGADGIDKTIPLGDVALEGGDVLWGAVSTRARGTGEHGPLRRTRKLRALILLRSWRFSLLDIFLYSSGLGRQSSGSRMRRGAASLRARVSFSLSGGAFLMAPDMTAPLRLGRGLGSSLSVSSSKSERAFEVAGVPTSWGSMANMGRGEWEAADEAAAGEATGKSKAWGSLEKSSSKRAKSGSSGAASRLKKSSISSMVAVDSRH
jgi:hypothetical protein